MSQNGTQATQARHFYDRISSAYDAISDSSEHEVREAGLKALDVQSGESVLEVGFGTGHSIVAIAQAVGKSGHAYGIDVSQGMYDVASKRVAKAGVQEQVELQVKPAPPLPFEDASLDAVFMSMTLELFPENVIPKLIEEVKRVLKPGGRFGVVSMAMVNKEDHTSVLESTYIWMHHHFPHIVDCQPIDPDDILEHGGFKMTHSERQTIWTMPVAIVVGKKA
ncbi:class I SAM-dependent methyltransferase [Rubinisphaera italica]|uniref:Demethylmenaquinone methyltransferase n=1 Tax=Rubinisphaera italica TaxID=2527969 RepID=A0A5C5XIB1_9PLAN|nr:methyltransferase domain-containing protein [Rubinisphaera italica]TWT62936.1 Demethylmenaquinone methyltransferase [Rubinisphaera italica]